MPLTGSSNVPSWFQRIQVLPEGRATAAGGEVVAERSGRIEVMPRRRAVRGEPAGEQPVLTGPPMRRRGSRSPKSRRPRR